MDLCDSGLVTVRLRSRRAEDCSSWLGVVLNAHVESGSASNPYIILGPFILFR